jgi:hypothetical protein
VSTITFVLIMTIGFAGYGALMCMMVGQFFGLILDRWINAGTGVVFVSAGLLLVRAGLYWLRQAL